MDMPYQSLTIRTSSTRERRESQSVHPASLILEWPEQEATRTYAIEQTYDGTMGVRLPAGLDRAYFRLQLNGKIDGVCYEAFRVSGVMQCARLCDIGARHNLYLRTQ